jgi:hypothetical protein
MEAAAEASAGATPTPKPQGDAAALEVSVAAATTPDEGSPAVSEGGEGERLSQEEEEEESASEKAAKQGELAADAVAEESSEHPSIPAPLVLPPEETSENGHAPIALDGAKYLMVNDVVATPEGTIHATVDMTSPSAVEDRVGEDGAAGESVSQDQADGETDTETNDDASELPVEADDGTEKEKTTLEQEEDGSGEHATIKEVTESSDSPKTAPTDEKVEQLLARIRDKCVRHI